MNRKLASIQVIKDVQPISGADKIEVVTVLGWKVVARKGEFKVGDHCVYFEIDSVIPRTSWSNFLFKHPEDTKFRLKTVRLRGCLSQGLVIPISSFIADWAILEEGTDLSESLKIEKYEPTLSASLAGDVRCSFPSIARKSDELRIQSFPLVLKELQGKEVYWSIKMDGTSASFMNIEGDIHVCSRNLSLKETEDNTYWKMFRKYDIERILKDCGSFSIMGEIIGPSIQKNRMGLKDHEFNVFSVYDIKSGSYLGFFDFKAFCSKYNLTTVPIEKVEIFNYDSVETLVSLANGVKYANGNKGEGYVIRPTTENYSEVLGGRLSIKVINNSYLLANDE